MDVVAVERVAPRGSAYGEYGRELRMTLQFITTETGERLVVIPESKWLAIQEMLEDREDLAAIDEFQRKLAAGAEEFIPSEMVDRLLSGENLIRVWREYRGLDLAALAAAADVPPGYLAEVEAGNGVLSSSQLARVATALNLTVDDLIYARSKLRITISAQKRVGMIQLDQSL